MQLYFLYPGNHSPLLWFGSSLRLKLLASELRPFSEIHDL